MSGGLQGLMMAGVDMPLFPWAALIAISLFLLWQWETRRMSKKRDEFRRMAYERLATYRSRSDHPKYAFSGQDATVVLRKEEFVPKDGGLPALSYFYAAMRLTNTFSA